MIKSHNFCGVYRNKDTIQVNIGLEAEHVWCLNHEMKHENGPLKTTSEISLGYILHTVQNIAVYTTYQIKLVNWHVLSIG